MEEAKGQGERTNALHLGTWLYIDIYMYMYIHAYIDISATVPL